MADNEIDSIIQNCTNLMCHIFSSDSRLDDIIRRTYVLNGKIRHITEYQHCIDSVNASSVGGNRRASLLGELQVENKKIIQYQNENRDLKCTIRQCMDTLDILMNKHRELSKTLANSEALPSLGAVSKLINANCKAEQESESSRKFIHDMLKLLGKAGSKTNNQDAIVAQLTMENKGLREMLTHAEISNPGMQSKFTNLLAEMRKHDEVNGSNSEDNSAADKNITVIEVPKESDTEGNQDTDMNITMIEMPKY